MAIEGYAQEPDELDDKQAQAAAQIEIPDPSSYQGSPVPEVPWQDINYHHFYVGKINEPTDVPGYYEPFAMDSPYVSSISEAFGAEVEGAIRGARIRNTTGYGYNPQHADQDRFLLAFEQAYYANRGKIDISWLAQFEADDLALVGLTPQDSDVWEALKHSYDFGALWQENLAYENERLDLRADFLVEHMAMSREQAYQEIELIDRIEDSIQSRAASILTDSPEGIALWLAHNDPNFVVPFGKTVEEAAAERAESTDIAGLTEAVHAVLNSTMRPELEEQLQVADLSAFGLGPSVNTRQLEQGTTGRFRDTGFKAFTDAFGILGWGMTQGANGFAWLVNEVGSFTNDTLQVDFGREGSFEDKSATFARGFRNTLETWFGGTETVEGRQAAKDYYGDIAAMPRRQVTMAMAIGPLTDQWDIMKDSDPATHAMWMAIAGMDEQMAFGLWAEDTAFHSEWAEYMDDQARLYQEDAEVQLMKLSDDNYTLSNALLDSIAVWGEGVDKLGVVLYEATEHLFQGKGIVFEPEQYEKFVDDINKYGSVSESLSIDGTLTGLSVDLLIGALVDPTTYMFGPGLAKAARRGPVTPEIAAQQARSRGAHSVHKGLADVVRGNRPGRAHIAALDSYAVSGHAPAMTAALGGWNDPVVINARAYLDHDVAKHTVDVNAQTVLDLIDEDMVTSAQLKAAMAELDEHGIRGARVPRIEYNPDTGRAALVANADMAAAIVAKEGADAIPISLKQNVKFGTRKGNGPGMPEIDADDFAHIEKMRRGVDTRTKANRDKREVNQTTRDILDSLQENISDRRGAYGAPIREHWVARADGKGVGKLEVYNSAGAVLEDGSGIPLERAGGGLVVYVDDTVVGYIEAFDSKGRAPTMEVAVREGWTGKHFQLPDGRSIIDVMYDVGREEGTEFLRFAGRSSQVSNSAMKSAQRQAKRWWDEQAVDVADEAVPTHERSWSRVEDVEDEFVNPRRVLTEEEIYGDIDWDRVAEVETQHILDGGDPAYGQRTAVSIGLGRIIRGHGGRGAVGRWVERHLTPINNNLAINFTHPNSQGIMNQIVARVWGSVDDLDAIDFYGQRILRFYEERYRLGMEAEEQAAKNIMLRNQIEGLKNGIGNGSAGRALTTVARLRGDATSPALVNAQRRWIAVQKKINDLEKELLQNQKLYETASAQLNNYQPLYNMLDEMYDDFNRKHIATNPHLADLVDPETGLVPWERINGGRRSAMDQIKRIQELTEGGMDLDEAIRTEVGYVPSRLKKALSEDDNISMFEPGDQEFFDQVMHNLGTPTQYIQPLDPLTLMIAPHTTRSGLGKVIHARATQNVMHGLDQAHQWWMIDKVMTPRTAAVVTIDELQRMWHTGGVDSWFSWLEDRAAFTAQYARFTRQNNRLSRRWQQRLQRLESYPTYYRQLERSFLETQGVGKDSITFQRGRGGRVNSNNLEYYEAAQRVAGQHLNEAYFWNYAKGPEAFKEWFDTHPQAEALRKMEYTDPADGLRKSGPPAELVYMGIDTVVEKYFLHEIKPGKKAQARKIWMEAAAESEARGSTRAAPVQLPNWVLEGFGSVTGNKKIPRATLNPMRAVDWMSDQFFQRPINYRRGFLAEQVRASEMARLEKLYKNSGIKIVSESEWNLMLRRNFPAASRDVRIKGRDHLQRVMRERYQVVSRRHLQEVVEHKVVAEMENQLYAFENQSRAGRAARAVFPFGKPWADMWGFWGREALSRPQMRGYLTRTNHPRWNNVWQKVENVIPFNPRTPALISRLAATDFDLENIDEDPIFGGLFRAAGIEEFDVSPALFLPTDGSNPFMTMIPGLGIVPTGIAHALFDRLAPDPVEDPQGYQLWLRQWGAFLPGLGYNRPHGISEKAVTTLLGGGVISRTGEFLTHADLIWNPDQAGRRNVFTGDGKIALTYLRGVQLNLGTDDGIANMIKELNELPPGAINEVTIEAIVDDMLVGVSNESAREAGWPLLTETIGEYLVPARIKALDVQQDLADVWINGLEKGWFPGLDANRFDLTTEDGKARAANSIRSHFFDLPDNDRDLLLVEHPGLAVNLVSMWEKTDLGEQILGELPYRSGGSDEERARHATYIEQGYITPKTPREFAIEIIGLSAVAEQNVLKNLYEEVTGDVNEGRWQWAQGKEEVMESLNHALGVAKKHDLGPWKTVEDVYKDWNNVLDQVVRWHMEEDPNRPVELKQIHAMTEEEREEIKDKLRSRIQFPSKYHAWGETMPSSRDALKDTLQFGFPILAEFVSDEALHMAEVLGVNLRVGDEFVNFYQSVADKRATAFLENPLYIEVMPEFVALRTPRSAGRQAFESVFSTVLDYSEVSPQTRTTYKQALLWLDEAQRLRAQGAMPQAWTPLRDKGVERLARMMSDDGLKGIDVPGLYNDAFGNYLGEFGWEPDEPPALMRPDGNLNPNAQRIFVRNIVDGDTITVSSERLNETLFGLGPDTAPKAFTVRLLGINAREMAAEGGDQDRNRLVDTLTDAMEQGLPIYVVRDPERYSNTDMFGRQFSWLYIGEEPYYFPETLMP